MRILFLADRIPPYNLGGGGKIPWRLARGFHARGHEVFIVTSTREKSYREVREGIPVFYVHSRYPARFRAWVSLWNPQTIFTVRHLTEQIQPDVVNVHNIHEHLSYAVISDAAKTGFPVVFSAHDMMTFAYGKPTYIIDPGDSPSSQDDRLPGGYNLREMRFRYNPFRNITIRRILWNHTSARIAISEAHRHILEANDLPPFRVIYHGFDAEEYQKPSDDVLQSLRQRFDLEGRRVVFFGGRLTELKGSRQLLLALDKVAAQVPNVRLLLLSSMPVDTDQLTGLQNLNESHICHAGWLSGKELLAAYHLSDVIPVPSIYPDPLPTTAFEGMAVGKPVIVSCFGGSPELVIDGKTGYVVNPFDVEIFAARLVSLLQDSDLREKIGNAGREHLKAHFSFKQQLDNTFAVYEDALVKR